MLTFGLILYSIIAYICLIWWLHQIDITAPSATKWLTIGLGVVVGLCWPLGVMVYFYRQKPTA